MYVSLLHNSFLGVQQTIRKLLAAKMLQISLESFLIKVNLLQKLASRNRIYVFYFFDRWRRFYPMQKPYKISSKMARVALLMDGSVAMSQILPSGENQ